MPEIKINTRRVRAGDVRKLREMIHALADHHSDAALVRNEHLSRDVLGPNPWVTIIIAEAALSVVGYAALLPLTKLQDGVRGMEIAHLYVDESARGKGSGERLMAACETEASSRHCASLTVGTHAENAAAQRIYRRAGYEIASYSGMRFRKTL